MKRHVAWLTAMLLVGAVSVGAQGRRMPRLDAQPMATDAKKDPKKKSEPGSVRIHYLRQKVTGCKRVPANSDGEVCEPALAPAPTETKVVFKPTGDAAGRKDVTVAFPSQAKKQSKDVRLPAGKWTLEWSVAGSKLKERFFVVAGDEFDVTLETIQGACSPKGQGCTLAEDKKIRSVEIPQERLD